VYVFLFYISHRVAVRILPELKGVFMKKSLCAIGISFAISSVVSALEISQDFGLAMSQDSGRSRVIITFRDKINREKLSSKGSAAEVQRSLQANFTASSKEFRSFLNRLQDSGRIQTVSELWAANAMVVDADNDLLEELSSVPDIAHLSLDRVIPLEELPENSGEEVLEEDYTYGLKMLGVDKIRKSYGLTGKGVVVGILDSGIDATHKDLAGKVKLWKDFAGNSETPTDGIAHGTHCAGTISGGNASGKQIGVAPGVKLIVGRIFGDTGSASLAGILEAMNWIADPDGNPNTNDAPRLISNSWGGRQGSMESEKSMWNLVQTWRSLNIVPVFAAGNSGPWPKTVGTPGGYPHSYAVGATDSRDQIARFSSRGPIAWDGKDYIKPDISAPGVDIYSTTPGGNYRKMSGTSMACPHMSGVIALMLEANPALTVVKVEELLNSTAKDLGEKGKDSVFGHGRADAFAVIQKIKDKKSVERKDMFDQMFE
jgi:subtilisin family serine protease